MATLVRPAIRVDLARLTEIYNQYVLTSAVTFDLEPSTIEQRAGWFMENCELGSHRLLVAEEKALLVVDYAAPADSSQSRLRYYRRGFHLL